MEDKLLMLAIAILALALIVPNVRVEKLKLLYCVILAAIISNLISIIIIVSCKIYEVML